MKLIVNSEGVYLSKVGECFCLKKDGQKQEISAKKVEQILITTSTALTTDAIELAVENNIDIVREMFDERFVRMWTMYLYSCAACFNTGVIDLHQIVFTNGVNNSNPLTRDYLYR